MNISNNPLEFGRKLKTGFDYFASGFTKSKLVDVFYHLIADKRQGQLLLECADFAEIDAFYNPGDDETDRMTTEMLLEAIRVKQYAQTDKTMAALQRVLNKHLASVGEITAGEATIGKPKKNGLFASVTVQFPLSDGQTLSIIFHSPDNNKMKITAADEILAFRWLLNKRDITNAVSPDTAEGGTAKDVSLEEVGIRCAQLIAKNSARFQAKSADLVAAKKLMEETQAQVAALQTGNTGLQDSLKAQQDAGGLIDAQINATQKQLEKQIAYNDELRAKLDGLKAVGAGNSGKAKGVDTTAGVDRAAADAALFEEKKAAFEQELTGRGFEVSDTTVDAWIYKSTSTAILTASFERPDSRGFTVGVLLTGEGVKEEDKDFSSATVTGLDKQITKALAWIDKKLAEMKKVTGATINNPIDIELDQLASLGTVNIHSIGEENIYFTKDGKYYYSKVYDTEDYQIGEYDFAAATTPSADENVNPEDHDIKALREMWTAQGVPEERQNEILTEIKAKAQSGAQVGPFVVPSPEVTSALGILNDIVGGKYDNSDDIMPLIEQAAATLETAGLCNADGTGEQDELLGKAADFLTDILDKEAA